MEIDVQTKDPVYPPGLHLRASWGGVGTAGESTYTLEALELRIGDQRMDGAGCVVGNSPPALNLSLSSAALDLDKFYDLIAKWRSPGSNSSETTAPSDGAGEPGTGSDLPFDLALRVEIEQATYGDAIASGVTLKSGSQPECSEAL
jgi:hypothetical protein